MSMIKSDLLFQLDLRLREITQKKNKLFGGITVIFFGDIMQLRPCKGSFIFDAPTCKDYLVTYLCRSHWCSFDVIMLEENHRQGSDREYAEVLNRIRVGKQTSTDIELLRTRIRPDNHPDLQGAMYITCTNKTVLKMNKIRLSELNTELVEIEAINIHPTIKNFKPKVEEKGTVGGTAFMQTLQLKVGAKVMLIHNIDVLDGLFNGARGVLVSIEKDSNDKVETLMIEFDEYYQGAAKRKTSPKLQKQFPGCTPIRKFLCSYSLAKKSTVASATAQVYQFPVVVCFAATTHKFQGGTVHKPNRLAADLRTVFDDAMAYVMLSRVQDLNQLLIVGDLPEKKIRTSQKCLEELDRLKERSINNNLPDWENNNPILLRISVLNCHSLLDKFEDIRTDKMLQFSDVICLCETWLKNDDFQPALQIDGYKLHLNSYGNSRGKGVALYYKEWKFDAKKLIKQEDIQVSKLSSPDLDIVAIYRSSRCHNASEVLVSILNGAKDTLICGDFNICFKQNRHHPLINILENLGFSQFVKEATHIDGGCIDQVYYRKKKNNYHIDVDIYSPYYTALDHDALLVTVKE